MVVHAPELARSVRTLVPHLLGTYGAHCQASHPPLRRTQSVAVSARITTLGSSVGYRQGSLAGDRQNLHAILKVIGPILYSYLFGLGCRLGRPELPFLVAASFAALAALLVQLSSRAVWTDAADRSVSTGDADEGRR